MKDTIIENNNTILSNSSYNVDEKVINEPKENGIGNRDAVIEDYNQNVEETTKSRSEK